MTNIHLTSAAADAAVTGGSGTKWKADFSAGASSRHCNRNGTGFVSSPLQVTDGATAGTDGTAVSWYTPPLQAVTIAGAITCSLWCRENATNNNVAPTIRVERCSGDGTVLSTIVFEQTNHGAGEMGGTTAGASQVLTATAANVTDTALSDGDRLRITLWIDSAAAQGGTGVMSTSGRGEYWVNGPVGSQGQAQFAFTETLALYTPPSGTTYQLTASGSGTSDGTATTSFRLGATASGTGTFAVNAGLTAKLAASANGSGTSTGQAALIGTLTASASGTVTSGGQATPAPIQASANGSGTSGGSAAATLVTPIPITASGSGTSTGQAPGTLRLAATASGAATSDGGAALTLISAPLVLTASGSGTSAGSAALDIIKTPLAITASGSGTSGGSAGLTLLGTLAASGAASPGGAAPGMLVLAGSGAGSVISSGAAPTTSRLAATANGTPTAAGSAALGSRLAATASGSPVASGAASLRTILLASGTGAGAANGSANLVIPEKGRPYTPRASTGFTPKVPSRTPGTTGRTEHTVDYTPRG